MKKNIIIAMLMTIAFSQMNAQVTFRPGVRAGVNFSHFTKGDYYNNNYYYNYDSPYQPGVYQSLPRTYDYSTKTDFYVGVYGKIQFTKFYALQPEFDYSRQGSKLQFTDPNIDFRATTNIDVSYLSITLINKFSFNKFNFHFGPTLEFVVDKNRVNPYPSNSNSYLPIIENDADLGGQVGVGYNVFKNLGIEARVKKGFATVVSSNDNRNNVNFSLGATYTFDVK